MSMEIKFNFDFDTAMRAMAFFAHHIVAVEKVKITKLMYLADKEHFLKFGWPITGDTQYAMKHGPVPSDCLHALNGELWPDFGAAFKYLHVSDNSIYLKCDPGIKELGASAQTVLREILRKHGQKNQWELRDETHELPEYKEVYREGTSTPIPWEIILKHSGDPKHFRLNRPVISKEMRAHMSMPFRIAQ